MLDRAFFVSLTFWSSAIMSTAQVVVTDVVPDQVFDTSGDTSFVDMNNDGADDLFIVYWRSSTGDCECPDGIASGRPSRVSVTPLTGYSIAVDQLGRAKELDSLEIIDQSSTWNGSGPITMAWTGTYCAGKWGCVPNGHYGEWYSDQNSGSPDGFLGVRSVSQLDTLFGWVRGVVPHYFPYLPGFILRAYGLHTTAGQPIFAGSGTSVGIRGDMASVDLRIGPNPTSSNLIVHRDQALHNSEFRILNLTGQQLLSFPSQLGNTDAILDIGTLDAGVYLLEISTPIDRYVVKVVKQ